VADGAVMLTAHIERYVALRQTLGFRLRNTARHLRAFARFATAMGDTHIRTSTAIAWATDAPSPSARHIRLRDVTHLARFLHAEDPAHEVPPSGLFPAPKVRPLPYIYAPEEVAQIVAATGRLRRTYPLRREVYSTLFGLIAATGLRVSEALDLRFDDLRPDGVLLIRRTKFGKSRLVPLHPTVADALDRYLGRRRRLAVTDDHVFLSAGNRRIAASMVNYTFRRVVRLAGVAAGRTPPCRIHDLRHTFATRSLQQCSTSRESVARHFVSLATYLGHTDIVHTYWYLEATPELMTDIATAAEALVAKGGA
jgi:integrase/recombinase XerD